MEFVGHFYQFLDIYNIDVRVAVDRDQLKHLAENEGVFKRLVRKKKNLPSGCTARDFGTRDGAPIFLIAFWMDREAWIKAGSHPHKLAEIAAHEAAHATTMVWDHIGADTDPEAIMDEPFAYLVGWFTEKLYSCVVAEDQLTKQSEPASPGV